MFYLMRGSLEIQEIGKVVGSGTLVGEIGVFARNRKRMATVVCKTDCEVYQLSDIKAKELFPEPLIWLRCPSNHHRLENMNSSPVSTQIAESTASAMAVHAQSVSH
jgi:CRP-like cAMP-binding protein